MSSYDKKMGAGSLAIAVLLPFLLFAYQSPSAGDSYEGAASSGQEAVQDEDTTNIRTLPGFEVQELYEVDGDEEGSWVALTVGPDGNLIASDEGQAGLYRIAVDGDIDNPEVNVEKIMMPASGAQGLEWAFDHFYTNINGVGLFRLSRSGNADQFNMMEYIEESPDGGGEHGNHSVILTEDEEGLYVVNGNHTPLPDTYTSRNKSWDEDILLPRNWDARGHARGIMAPGGYIARIPPDGTQWDIVTSGFRNTYDIAVSPQGEMFAYDSDMEWDMGMPWYRPTRILHAVSGADYGWRSGSGKWKAYYEDSLPAVLNIGPGSPTGLLFGTGARFPARYQRALFGLDWTFGTIYALHLTPEGASYTAESEEFLSGSPLPVTSAVVGEDGHLYFTTGGRGQQSYLYRVVYTGDESTEPAGPAETDPAAQEAREQRHQLEAFHGEEDPEALETAWPFLDDEDRFLRNAARVAIEWQPVDTWAERALTESSPQARITAMVALARVGSDEYRSDATESLIELDLADLSADQQLSYLRALSLIFQRLGDPSEQQREQITDSLQEQLPHDDERVNVELVRLLVYLDDPQVIDKALALIQRDTPPSPPDWDESLLERSEDYGGTIMEMLENPPPTVKLEYAYMLRNMSRGWTIDQRRDYFAFINEAADQAGGASYTGFLERMRSEALSNATEEEIAAVSDLTGVSLARQPDFEITPPEGPGREWTLEAAVEEVDDNLDNQDFERGRSLFHAIGCAACHRFGGYGGNIGPDLSAVANRFGVEGILEDIIHPSRVISDQYSSSDVVLEDGETITGLVVQREDSVEVYTRDPDAPPTVVRRSEVQTIRQVDVSQMPANLLNTLNPEELRDLMAYMISGGDPEDEVYVGEEEDETTEEEQEE